MNNALSIVIDADIARSSGTSEHPLSSGSRALLENISKNNHKAAICPTLMAEWKKHRSLYAMKWLASMVARKKVSFIKPVKKTGDLIDAHINNKKQTDIAKKDAHLVDAALISDKIITSNDDAARRVFCDLSDSCGDIKTVKWFNAITNKDFISVYFSDNCFVPKVYYLCNK